MVSKRCLFENHRNRKGHPKPNFIKVRHWDPLKIFPGSGFEKTRNNYGKRSENLCFFMVPNYWKVLKNILFLILGHSKNDETTMPKGIWQIMFSVLIGDTGLPCSTFPLIFDVLVRCQKIIVFRSHPDKQTKNKKNFPKHARKHNCRQRLSSDAGWGPWGGHARDRERREGKKPIGEFKREGGNIGKF